MTTIEYRSPAYQRDVTQAIEDLGLDITYKDVEKTVHKAMGARNLPWWNLYKSQVYRTEGGVEAAAYYIAGHGLALYAQGAHADHDHRLMRCMYDAADAYRNDHRKTWDGNRTATERYPVAAPKLFSELEHEARDAGVVDGHGVSFEDILHGIMPEPAADPALDFDPADPQWEDPRLQEMWALASPKQRAMLIDVAMGMSQTAASYANGHQGSWARQNMVRLKERIET